MIPEEKREVRSVLSEKANAVFQTDMFLAQAFADRTDRRHGASLIVRVLKRVGGWEIQVEKIRNAQKRLFSAGHK